MTTKLWNYFRSSASWRVRIALNFKGIEYEYVPVSLVANDHLKDDYRALNPLQAVPTLEIDGHRFSESMSIIEYLEETRPTPPLLPGSPLERAHARRIAEAINAGIQPLQNLRVLRKIDADFRVGEPGKKAWGAHFNEVGLRAVEELVKSSAGTFCLGDAVTVADVFLVPQLFGARRFGVDLAAFPTLVRVESALAQLPAFARAHASKQPDTPAEAR